MGRNPETSLGRDRPMRAEPGPSAHLWAGAFLWLALAGGAQAATYPLPWNVTNSRSDTVMRSTHSFIVDGVFGSERYVRWYVGSTFRREDHSHFFNGYLDPTYTISFSGASGTYTIKAYEYTGSGATGYVATHTWTCTVDVPGHEPPWGSDTTPYGMVDDLADETCDDGFRHDSPSYRYYYARRGVLMSNDNVPSSALEFDADLGFTDLTGSPPADDLFLMYSPLNNLNTEPERCFRANGGYIPWQHPLFTGKFSWQAAKLVVSNTPSGFNYHLFRKHHLKPQLTDMLTGGTIGAETGKVVVLIHGWNPERRANPLRSGDWNTLRTAMEGWLAENGTNGWRVVEYNWAADADTGPTNGANPARGAERSGDSWPTQNGTEAAEAAHLHGQALGESLATTCPQLSQVQFIAHSAGSWCARTAARHLLLESVAAVQVTLLDSYMPREGDADSVLGKAIMGRLDTDYGRTPVLLENYYSRYDEAPLSTSFYNVGTAQVFGWGSSPSEQRQLDTGVDGLYAQGTYWNHSGPIRYYADTISGTVTQEGFWGAWVGADHGWRRSLPYRDWPATVATEGATGATADSAVSGGVVVSEGGSAVVERGVCWSTSPGPTTADDRTRDGSGSGAFASYLTGLTPDTLYYVRAYATNSSGTSYGADVPFATKRLLVVIADDHARYYGDANPQWTVSYAGFAPGEGEADLATPPMVTCGADAASSAGAYDIVPGGGEDDAYAFDYVNGTLTVAPAPLTCTADDKTKAHGQSNPALTITYSGLKNGDPGPATPPAIACAATESSSEGPYPITLSGGADASYALTLEHGTLTVLRGAAMRIWVDDGESIAALDFGEVETATPGFDPSWDAEVDETRSGSVKACLLSPLPPEEACRSLRCDFRPCADTTRWRLVLPEESRRYAVTLSWDVAAADGHRAVYLQRMRGEQTMGFPVDMRTTAWIEAAPDSQYEIAYAETDDLPCPLSAGWSLVGNPIMTELSIGEVLSDGGRGSLHIGPVWTFEDGAYRRCADSEPFSPERGHWIYSLTGQASQPATGIRADGLVALQPGWNLVSPVSDCDVPGHRRIRGPVLSWHAPSGEYRKVAREEGLQGGVGYWICIDGTDPCVIRLGE